MEDTTLVLNKSLDDAIMNSMYAIEKGQFDKVINLLEYVIENKEKYDEVMVNYALLVSYMNTSRIKDASKILKELDEMNIDNAQINTLMDTVRSELEQLRNTVSTDENLQSEIVKIEKNLNLTVARLSKINIEAEDRELLKKLYDQDQTSVDILSQICRENINIDKKIDEYLLGYTKETKHIDAFETLKLIENNLYYWLYADISKMIKIIKKTTTPTFIKRSITYQLVIFNKKNVVNDRKIKSSFLKEEKSLKDLPSYTEQSNTLYSSLIGMYSHVESEDLNMMIESVLLIIINKNYPNNVFTKELRLMAIVCYIVNDIYLGREFDKKIERQLGIKFVDVKKEILKYEDLINYLLT